MDYMRTKVPANYTVPTEPHRFVKLVFYEPRDHFFLTHIFKALLESCMGHFRELFELGLFHVGCLDDKTLVVSHINNG